MTKRIIPQHIAFIMDGNGRWAKQKNLPRSAGHAEGAKRVKEIVNLAGRMGVKVVSFFAFSSENWSRPKAEVKAIFSLLDRFLSSELKNMLANNVRFRIIGRKDSLPPELLEKIIKAEKATSVNSGITLVLAVNYGGRQEIVDALKSLLRAILKGEASIQNINEQTFANFLYTAGLPDPDILIRTSGEMRISNFMLWQLSYSEFYFSKKFWPEFKEIDLIEAVDEYNRRERRFGGVDA